MVTSFASKVTFQARAARETSFQSDLVLKNGLDSKLKIKDVSYKNLFSLVRGLL